MARLPLAAAGSPAALRCDGKIDCGNPQRHQRVAEQIGKFQVVLKPRRSGLQHGLNELILQQDPVPLDEHVIQMVGWDRE